MGKESGVKGTDGQRVWINDLEIPDAQVKWAWSHFAGEKATFNDAGDHNFIVILPEEDALKLLEIPDGWAIKRHDPREEGDPPEYTLKAHISYRFEQPDVYIIKGNRRFKATEEDLSDIKRSTCERIDVILGPSRWRRPTGETGVTAYVKEMYVVIRESRFAAEYADYEEVRDDGERVHVDS